MLPFIAVMMMLWLPAGMPIAAYAEEAGDVPTVYASDAQGNVGDIVEVNIGIRNNPGIVATRLTAHYDASALRLDSVVDKGLFGETTLLNQLTSPYIMLWDNSAAPENYTGNGDQITLRFEVLSDSGSDIKVTYNEKPGDIDILNFDLDPVYFAVVNGSVSVNGEPALLESIAVTAPPSKTTYFAGEALDLTGLVVTATYNDGSSQAVTGYSTSPAEGAALNIVGQQSVTVSYEGITTSFTVTVNAIVIESITVTTPPSKTTYFAGEALDLAGLVVTATYNNGSSQAVTGYSTSLDEGAALNIVGQQSVTVSYEGKSAEFTVTVNEVVIESIAVTTPPLKTMYFAGERLDLAGLVITATYNNGNSQAVTDYGTLPAAGAALNNVGQQSVTVSYEGMTAEFTVTVNEVVVTSIAVTAPPSKSTYFAGEALDLAGLVITATYNDGSSQAVTGYSTSPAAGAALNSVGQQSVTVSYEGLTAGFIVTVQSVTENLIIVRGMNPEYQIGLAIQETGEIVYEPEFPDAGEIEFVVTGIEGPFMLWLGIKDIYPGIFVEDIEADESYDIDEYFYETEVPEGVSSVGISLIEDVWYLEGIGEGETIQLLKTYAEALLVFDYKGSRYEETFILDGTNPFREFSDDPDFTIHDMQVVATGRLQNNFFYEVSALVTNNGDGAKNVRAVLVEWPESVTVIDGSLHFGRVSSGATVLSEDTFTIYLDRTVLFEDTLLKFDFLYDPE